MNNAIIQNVSALSTWTESAPIKTFRCAISRFPRPVLAVLCAASIALCLFAGAIRGSALTFIDKFETDLTNRWTATGQWGLTTASALSPSHAASDSPGSFYTDNTDAALTMANSVKLVGLTRPVLSFWHHYSLEEEYDFGYVEVSTDGGASWHTTPLAAFTGEQPDWIREQLDLSPYASANQFRARFRLVTDASVVMDGWHIDDVRIGEAPAPVTLSPPTAIRPNSISLSWSASTATNFLAYQVYRALSPGQDWHEARLVGQITSPATTTLTDATAVPKTRYYYRVMVVNLDQLHALSNELTVSTPAGMDYPFLDNGEAGGGAWVAALPWALI
jgi:hypothetical protein